MDTIELQERVYALIDKEKLGEDILQLIVLEDYEGLNSERYRKCLCKMIKSLLNKKDDTLLSAFVEMTRSYDIIAELNSD
jgi:hypothetical protein